MSDERNVLLASLDAQRAHVLGTIDGLSDAQLREAVLPSGWCFLGMIKHLALSDEHYWFHSIIGGESLDFFPSEPEGDWKVGATESAAEVIDLYRQEIDRVGAEYCVVPGQAAFWYSWMRPSHRVDFTTRR